MGRNATDATQPDAMCGVRPRASPAKKRRKRPGAAKYPRQGENKPGFTREKPKGRGAPGAQSGTTSGSHRAGLKKTAKKAQRAKKANGRKGGAR